MRQHVEVLGDPHYDGGIRPEPGPIALMPTHNDVFAAAVERAGGTVTPLGPRTRGLLWLSEKHATELDETLAHHPGISWVQLPWAGVDRFALSLTKHSKGRIFTSAKGAYAQPVAEHALGLILALLRYLPRRARLTTWDAEILGRSLYGLNVTIIGAGGIARELMRLLAPFDVSVSIVRRSDRSVPGALRTLTSQHLHDALVGADVLVVAAALTESTTGLIGSRELGAMPSGSVVVNVARGSLIDSEALLETLASGHLAGAGLDVTDPEPLPRGHPLWTAPNIIITPHQADTPDMTAPLLAARIEDNVRAFLTGRPLVGVVDAALGY